MLDKYETALQENFDVKLRGRLGERDDALKQIRVLNRILHITSEGLTYEADPRHVELLSRSLGLQQSRMITTPGVKHNASLVDGDDQLDDPDDGVVQAVSLGKQPRIKHVDRNGIAENITQITSFDDSPTYIDITPYAGTFGRHLRSFVFTGPITNKPHDHMQTIPLHADRYTGLVEPQKIRMESL